VARQRLQTLCHSLQPRALQMPLQLIRLPLPNRLLPLIRPLLPQLLQPRLRLNPGGLASSGPVSQTRSGQATQVVASGAASRGSAPASTRHRLSGFLWPVWLARLFSLPLCEQPAWVAVSPRALFLAT